ncbi:Mitochondrial substrate carrier family protein S [Holothuria leucospilota]|uniref:Mitochondrial substrate carrier family protein S n=1 Tax=Holothuria leucospilota TaxID=206669 RepID=A0A9Q1HBL3_HOLLE|nr:Mitochondrial substrate carrier family protein S [Holothuria leucospilota]
MTHNQDRGHFLKEGAIGLGVGVLYGVTSVVVGHPFDTVKSKMQAQRGFESASMFRTIAKTFKTQGIIGFYRGSIPVLWGSGIYRSTQFGVFESVYTFLDNPFCKTEIPLTAGLQIRVLIAGACGSTARAIIESPLELAKIRRQTQQSWTFRGLYQGFGVMWVRTMGLMTTYFILIDTQRRHFPQVFDQSVFGPFLVSGVAATLAWWIVWPLEYMKSQVQANYGEKMPVLKRIRLVIKERGGFFGLYRGIGPGTIRSFISNGTSMIVMSNAQKKVTEWGLRD